MIFANPYNRALQSLGGFTDLLGAAAGALGSGGGEVGTGMTPSNQVTVNPNINVNPQISPIFQQQFQPTNSPISAGTSQGNPAAPYNGSGAGSGGGGVSSPLVPNVPQIPIDWNKYLIYGGLGLAALFAVKLLAGKKQARPRYRRRSTRSVK